MRWRARGDHLGAVRVDAKRANHVLVVASGAQGRTDFGSKEPVERGHDDNGDDDAHKADTVLWGSPVSLDASEKIVSLARSGVLDLPIMRKLMDHSEI